MALDVYVTKTQRKDFGKRIALVTASCVLMDTREAIVWWSAKEDRVTSATKKVCARKAFKVMALVTVFGQLMTVFGLVHRAVSARVATLEVIAKVFAPAWSQDLRAQIEDPAKQTDQGMVLAYVKVVMAAIVDVKIVTKHTTV